MSSAERCAASNAIWLCQTCAKLIDSDVLRYSIAALAAWKDQAEARAHDQLVNPSRAEEGPIQERFDEVIAATQPLSALSLLLRFTSSDSELRKRMKQGERRIRANAMSAQGGTPAIPSDLVDYTEALLPLLRYVARVGPRAYDNLLERSNETFDDGSIVLLMPLDDARNTILFFARISTKVSWCCSSKSVGLPDGWNSEASWDHEDRCMPRVLRAHGSQGAAPIYEISWTLDPAELAAATQRLNANISATGRLPKKLLISIFCDIGTLPFAAYDFTKSCTAGLWSEDPNAEDITAEGRIADASLTVTINSAPELTYCYRLKAVQRKVALTEHDDELPTRCTMLVFERF